MTRTMIYDLNVFSLMMLKRENLAEEQWKLVLICSAAGGDDCVPRSGDLVVRSQGGDGEGG